MKQAVIFALENSQNEPNYDKLAVLMVRSLLDTNPDIDIYCGIFTNRIPTELVLSNLKRLGVNILIDQRFDVGPESINYFLRNYCCYYFTSEHDLLTRYDQLVYLDIDVLVLNKLDISLAPNSILVEQVPDNIIEFEKKYIGVIDHPLYYNWIAIVNNDNKHVYDIDYHNNTYIKESDILISKNINASGLNIVHQDFGAYYPKHELTPNTIAFHYDGFINSGTFFRLEEYDAELHKKYSMYIKHILNIKQTNDKSFWNEL